MRRFAGCAVGVALAICSGVSVSAMPAPVKAPARYRSPSSVTDMVPTSRSHLAGSRRDVPIPTLTDDTPSLVTDAPQQPRPTASAPETTTGSSGMGMSSKLAIAVPIFFGGLILFAFIYFVSFSELNRGEGISVVRCCQQHCLSLGHYSWAQLHRPPWRPPHRGVHRSTAPRTTPLAPSLTPDWMGRRQEGMGRARAHAAAARAVAVIDRHGDLEHDGPAG